MSTFQGIKSSFDSREFSGVECKGNGSRCDSIHEFEWGVSAIGMLAIVVGEFKSWKS